MADTFKRDENEIGALWLKSGQNGQFYSGTINGVRVVAFPVKKKSENSPDLRVLKAKDQSESGNKPSSRQALAPDDVPF